MAVPGNTIIKLSENNSKKIEDLQINDSILQGFNTSGNILFFQKLPVEKPNIYKIETSTNNLIITGMHQIWTPEGWSVIDHDSYQELYYSDRIFMYDGQEKIFSTKELLYPLSVSTLMCDIPRHIFCHDTNMYEIPKITRIEEGYNNTILYSLMASGSHSHFANNILIGAWPKEDFNYNEWRKY